ncbi:MAG: hypothetical protein ACRDHY_00800, partial [Anaerolineales bacterium]
LLADLQAAGEVLDGGEWPNRAAQYYELRGIQRAWRILAAAVQDGEYDVEQTSRRAGIETTRRAR